MRTEQPGDSHQDFHSSVLSVAVQMRSPRSRIASKRSKGAASGLIEQSIAPSLHALHVEALSFEDDLRNGLSASAFPLQVCANIHPLYLRRSVADHQHDAILMATPVLCPSRLLDVENCLSISLTLPEVVVAEFDLEIQALAGRVMIVIFELNFLINPMVATRVAAKQVTGLINNSADDMHCEICPVLIVHSCSKRCHTSKLLRAE